MEKINDFLETNMSKVIEIIDSLASEFNSHDFLKKFNLKFESDYIEMLNKYGSFQNVNRMIALFLSENKELFHIDKTFRDKSENVHGNNTLVQHWKKV